VSTPLAARVDRERLWQRHMQLARHGATAAGGVNRPALSHAEIAARRDVIAWGGAIGLAASTDPAGNLFLRLDGRDSAAAPVLSGSHLDSQPTGGKFDGVYGVLAALEAVQAMREAGHVPARPVEVVAWMNEEGSRFAPGMMGSATFAGAAALPELLAIRDADGISVRDAVAAMSAAFPGLPTQPLGRPVAAYVEAHIEQGPVLERAGVPVGVVTGMQGKRTFRVTVTGEEAHAGTAPHRERRDALLAATAMIQALAAALHDPADIVRFTVGRLDVTPNAPSVIAGRAVFSIDLRHPDEPTLRALGDRVPAVCQAAAGRCSVTTAELSSAMPLAFASSVRETIAAAAQRLALKAMELPSAAGHDARYLNAICPSGMIFVPCKDGISHNEAESATPDDLHAGACVLVETLAALAA
jgi:N-carbamoyl-L-amino-acid hydrolase